MKILIFGGSGLVGSKFIDLYKGVFDIIFPVAEEVDILNPAAVSKSIEEFSPDAVINFAAFTDVEGAQKQAGDEEGICYLINAIGAKNVAQACKESDTRLIHISTDYVFAGTKSQAPYTEEEKPCPVNWYGRTKYQGENFILESGCSYTIARISMPFSPFYGLKKDIARFFLKQLKNGEEVTAVSDQKITPTNVNDITAGLRAIVLSKSSGIYHVCSKTQTTPLGFVRMIASSFNLDNSKIRGVSLEEYNKSKLAKMPKYSWLNSEKFSQQFGDGILHTIEEGVKLFKLEIDSLNKI